MILIYIHSLLQLLVLDAEAALQAESTEAAENEAQFSDNQSQNIEIAVISSKDNSRLNSPDDSISNEWVEVTPYTEDKSKTDTANRFIMPIILINDELPEDLDQKWIQVVESLTNSERFKLFHTRRKHKRKFCRKKHAVFKRSYSIA